VPCVTAKALRCNLRLELTVEEFLLLDRMPGAGHAVPARLHCELEHEHRGDHVAFAQTGEGASSSSAVWWMRWNADSRDVVELPYCLARDPGWPEDQDEDDPMFCGLPADHRAAHEWEMRSDPQLGCSQDKPNTRHQWVVNWRFLLVIRLLGAFGDGASCLARRG